ncbi:MAG: PPIC-type PPIase protein [uncultured bacterium]|nr:MAG: PPIC-type PPIase protein [uncultured bacterium]
MAKKQTDQDEKKIKISTLAYAVAIVMIVVVCVALVLAYGTRTEIGGKIAHGISRIVPFPAAIIDWRHIVFMNDVEENLVSVQKFYQTQNFASEGLRVDFTTENGKKRLKIKKKEIIDKMVEDRIIEILAKKQGITVSQKDVDQAVEQKLNEFGTAEEVKKDLINSYGWSIDDFKDKIVLPGMYSEALAQKVIANDPNSTKAKEKITQAQKQLEEGKDFAEVVRTYSEGSSKEKSGELGWVKKDQVVLELQEALFESDTAKKNDVIESSIGFHIIEIKNQRKEEGEDVLELRQIFVAKNTFADWLIGQKKQMKVMVPASEFVWDAKMGAIDFKDEEMRVFEKEERAKVQGDASIMF